MPRGVRRSVIVCPADASAGARTAVAQAAALAKVRHAELHLLHVPPARGGRPRGTHGEEEVHPVIAEAMKSTLDVVRGRGQHVRFRIRAQRGKPESAIALYARRHRAGLIVLPAGYGGRRGWAGGSLASTLGRSAPCPVLVVTATRGKRALPASFREVVCAVDLTKVSVSALEAASAFAPHRPGRLTLVHAVREISRGKVGRLLRLVPHEVSSRYRVTLVVASGRPYQLIVDVASEVEADLVVMGMPRRSRLDDWVAGSTSRAVLRRAKSPMLLVPE